MKFNIYISLILLLIMFSCTSNENTKMSSDDLIFADAYVELLNAQFNISPDSASIDTLAILQKYNFTKVKFEYCLQMFQENPEKWEVFFEYIETHLEANKTSSGNMRLIKE